MYWYRGATRWRSHLSFKVGRYFFLMERLTGDIQNTYESALWVWLKLALVIRKRRNEDNENAETATNSKTYEGVG